MEKASTDPAKGGTVNENEENVLVPTTNVQFIFIIFIKSSNLHVENYFLAYCVFILFV